MLLPMLRASFPLDLAATFLASMPERYRELYDGAAVAEHAAIVGNRGAAPAHVEMWRRLPHGGAVVCVVADDRPGLLSFISAALVLSNLDVQAAQAYTRPSAEGRPAEAVDFFWLKRDADVPLPVLQADVRRIAEVLSALVTGERTLEEITTRAWAPRPAPPGSTTRVSFDESDDASLVVLTVESHDRPGLLLAITQALYRARVQIIASDATTNASTKPARVVDRFTIVELDGAPIARHRRGVVQMEVLAAIDALAGR
jgi:[protein-PII] uridylyltransferase